jgi:hypothetical protein
MLYRTLLRSLTSALTPVRPGRNRLAPPRPRRGPLEVETLEDRSLPSTTVSIAAMGDSLTAPYTGQPWGAAGDQSWTQQLAARPAYWWRPWTTGRVRLKETAPGEPGSWRSPAGLTRACGATACATPLYGRTRWHFSAWQGGRRWPRSRHPC